jgi:hypothetical protein
LIGAQAFKKLYGPSRADACFARPRVCGINPLVRYY